MKKLFQFSNWPDHQSLIDLDHVGVSSKVYFQCVESCYLMDMYTGGGLIGTGWPHNRRVAKVAQCLLPNRPTNQVYKKAKEF